MKSVALEEERGQVDRLNFKRRLEPEGSFVLHGAGQSPASFKQYFELMGQNKPAVYMTYVNLKGTKRAYFRQLKQELERYQPYQLIPQIGLHLADDPLSPVSTPHYEAEVASGKWDKKTELFCQGLKTLNCPVFVRIGFEFNGPWNGYEPQAFKLAWQRIATAIREAAPDRVALVWCYYPLHDEEPGSFLNYYPGDEYVDWWAIDIFSAEDFSSAYTKNFLKEAERKGFPVMLGEVSARGLGPAEEGEANWHKWYRPFFDFIQDNPVIKAFCYINWNWADYEPWHDWGDPRIQQNQFILENYRRELENKLYRHAPLIQAVGENNAS